MGIFYAGSFSLHPENNLWTYFFQAHFSWQARVFLICSSTMSIRQTRRSATDTVALRRTVSEIQRHCCHRLCQGKVSSAYFPAIRSAFFLPSSSFAFAVFLAVIKSKLSNRSTRALRELSFALKSRHSAFTRHIFHFGFI